MPRILVVDDEKSIRTTLAAFLRADGYEAEIAEDADEAVALLKESDFDAVVSDIVLPRVSGVDLLEEIRNIAPRVQVIMMTGEPTVDTAARALRAGAFDYLLKPVSKNAVLRTVSNACRVKKLADEKQRLEEENRQYQEHLEDMVRKQTEALHESYAKYRGILENVSLGISLISPDMKVLELNRQMREWFPQANPAEKPLCYHVFNDPPGNDICLHCPCVQTLLDGRTHETTVERARHTSPVHYRLVTSPIRDSNGSVSAVIKLVEDITEKKKMEDQLRHAQKMEAVGQLAGGVAHDFNNILQVMLGYTSLVMKNLSPEHECYNDLEEIRTAIDRAGGLTRQLLIFSRRDIVETRDLDLNETIENTLKMLRRVLGEHIALKVASEENLRTIHADPGRIEQILMNLCINARDAMPHGGTITLETENISIGDEARERFPWAQQERYILLRVSDTGCGMSPKVQKHIFDPFFTTKEAGKGTGLGLATVHGIVTEYQGNIKVRSEVGKGSTFEVYLPAVERPATPRNLPAMDAAAAGGRERILLAEDDDTVRNIAVRVLERAGYTVQAVSDGKEAIEAVETQGETFDAVILDAVMPEKNGFEVYARLQALENPIPVLFCSGYIQGSFDFEPLKKSGVDLLHKPYASDKLLLKLRQLLDHARQRNDEMAKDS